MFAISGHETDRARAALFNSYQSAGDALLVEALRLFMLRPHIDDSRAGVLDSGRARKLRLLEWIDIIDMHLRREIRVLLQQVLPLLEVARLVVVSDLDVLLQSLHDLVCLFGKTEALVRSRVVRLVVCIRQVIRQNHHGENYQDIDCRVSGISGLSSLDPVRFQLTTSTGEIPSSGPSGRGPRKSWINKKWRLSNRARLSRTIRSA